MPVLTTTTATTSVSTPNEAPLPHLMPPSILDTVNGSVEARQTVSDWVGSAVKGHNELLVHALSPLSQLLGVDKHDMLPIAILIEVMAIASILIYWLHSCSAKSNDRAAAASEAEAARQRQRAQTNMPPRRQETERQREQRLARERKERERLAAKKEQEERWAQEDRVRAFEQQRLKKQQEAEAEEAKARIQKEWANAGVGKHKIKRNKQMT